MLPLKNPTVIMLSILCAVLSLTSCSKDTDLLAEYVITDDNFSIVSAGRVVDDNYSIQLNQRIILDVLNNDNFDAGSTVTIIGTTNPNLGTVEINEDNTLTYIPASEGDTTDENESSEAVEDTFDYTAEETNEDGETTTEDGTVTITTSEDKTPPSDNNLPSDFEYSSFSEAYEKSNLWFNKAVIKIKNLQGGLFTFDMNNVLEADGGTIFKVLARRGNLLRNWDNNGIVKAEWFGMKPNDDKFDNSVVFQSLIEAHKIGRVSQIEFLGTYNFDKTGKLNNSDGLILKGIGLKRSEFYTNNLDKILYTNDTADNISFINLKFNSEMSEDLGQGNSAGLVIFSDATFENHLYDNCEFTAPNATINGIKWWVSTPGDEIKNVKIVDSYFHDLGRMGIEAVNHYFQDNTHRFKNITIENSVFSSTGQKQYGMGISLSGEGSDIIIRNNDFTDNRTTAIELIGTDNVIVENNTARGLGSFIHAVNGTNKTNENLIFRNNKTDGIMEKGNILMQVDGLESYNNIFYAKSATFIQGSRNLQFNNNYYYSKNEHVFKVFTGSWLPVENIRFDNSIFETSSNKSLFLAAGSNGENNGYNIYCSTFKKTNGLNYEGLPNPYLENIILYNNGNYISTYNSNNSNCKEIPN
jgi:hypothetical protein